MKLFFYLVGVLAIMNMSITTGVSQTSDKSDPLPLTVAESSEYKSTSKSSEVVEFIDACVKKGNHVSRFNWGETVEGKTLVGAIVASRDYKLGDQDDRNVVLLLGNIHSGECAGKEALLILLRELTDRPDHPWLKENVILFAPNYNADGNDRMGKDNRPGQVGPVNGMGRRENAQQLDLNRDFSKIESPEARALVQLIDTCNPHLFVDCHTTNGSKHQYSLTYDIPHNPATAEPIRQFLREKMMPVVTQRLAAQGTKTFYYGNFNREHTRWTTYGHEPRYSTEYVGLRGRLAILSEAYSYLDYRGRIFATKDFV
ncbi:M14 family metallopeptidase, partial [Mariniblastus sp.]|nr:M14 family metallopeptidase [Mariniblastus sp.]